NTIMKPIRTIAQFAVAGLIAMAISSTAVAADRKTTNTILGAGLGAAAGAVLSNGDTLYTLGGAAAGGLLGNVLTEDRGRREWKGHKKYRHSDRRYVQQRKHRGHKHRHHR